MTGNIAIRQTGVFRWWFLPSWMGLDAPCVVSVWTWAISRAAGLTWPSRAAATMFLVVWSIYLSDRLFDVARCKDWSHATGRLRFGRRYQPLFLACLACALAGIVTLLWNGLPAEVLWRGVYVALGVALHFLLFVVPLVFRQRLPGKEVGVGLFFALGAFACLGATPRAIPMMASVALLVAYNCLIIAARDAESDLINDPGAASRWWKTMPRDLFWFGLLLTFVEAAASLLADERGFFLAAATAAAMLTALHHAGRRFSGDAVRALADFALFTPLALLAMVFVPL